MYFINLVLMQAYTNLMERRWMRGKQKILRYRLSGMQSQGNCFGILNHMAILCLILGRELADSVLEISIEANRKAMEEIHYNGVRSGKEKSDGRRIFAETKGIGYQMILGSNPCR